MQLLKDNTFLALILVIGKPLRMFGKVVNSMKHKYRSCFYVNSVSEMRCTVKHKICKGVQIFIIKSICKYLVYKYWLHIEIIIFGYIGLNKIYYWN